MRYTGPKNKIARREGGDLGFKTPGSKAHSNLLKRMNIIPGQHGAKRRRKMTDYAVQLRQKQKLKRIYGLTEKVMKNYIDKASTKRGNTASFLVTLLESRLDNVMYRSGLSPTRAASRQLISHGHISLNDKKVDIPSFQVRTGDVISLRREKTLKIPYIAKSLEKSDNVLPIWLERKGNISKIKNLPDSDSFAEDVNLQLVVEFYSR